MSAPGPGPIEESNFRLTTTYKSDWETPGPTRRPRWDRHWWGPSRLRPGYTLSASLDKCPFAKDNTTKQKLRIDCGAGQRS